MAHKNGFVIQFRSHGQMLRNLQILSSRWSLSHYETILLGEGSYLLVFFEGSYPSESEISQVCEWHRIRYLSQVSDQVWQAHLGMFSYKEIRHLLILEADFLGDQIWAAEKAVNLGAEILEMRSGRGVSGFTTLVLSFESQNQASTFQEMVGSELREARVTTIFDPTPEVRSQYEIMPG